MTVKSGPSTYILWIDAIGGGTSGKIIGIGQLVIATNKPLQLVIATNKPFNAGVSLHRGAEALRGHPLGCDSYSRALTTLTIPSELTIENVPEFSLARVPSARAAFGSIIDTA